MSATGARVTMTRSTSSSSAVVAFEVKAAQRVGAKELGPLRKLRDAAGGAFVAGIALHLGSRAYQAAEKLHVVPVDQLWTP